MHGEASVVGAAATRRRRLSFQRSHTVPVQPSLPEVISPDDDEDDQEHDEADEHSRLIRGDSPDHSSRGSSSTEMERSDEEMRPLQPSATSLGAELLSPPARGGPGRGHHQQRHSAPAGPSGLGQPSSKRSHFKQRSISVYNTNETAIQQAAAEGGRSGTRAKLGRTPSTPSVLLSKVKERIREKVFQTSTEWPHAAAIVQERRQRAVESYEARLSRKKSGEVEMEQIPMKDLHSKRKRGRMRSDPIPAVVASVNTDNEDFCPECDNPQASSSSSSSAQTSNNDPEAARQAFRRRSISEDTYDRPLTTHPAASAAYRHSSDSGVICSSMDLKAMKTDFNKRKSPKPSKQDLRTLSVEYGRSSGSNTLVDSQISMESVSSGYSARSGGSVSAGKYDSIEDESLISDTPSDQSGLVCPKQYNPRMVGDGGRNVTLQSSALLYGSLDESTPSHNEESKPVPEIVFDAQGQTWDVYGAEFDPEVLGEAIQRHLVRLMLSKTDSLDSEDGGHHHTETSEDEVEVHAERDIVQCQGISPCGRTSRDQGRRKSSDNSSFLFRLLCLFSGRAENEVAS